MLFLAPLGVNQSHAIALGLMVYGINLTVSLLGAPAFAVGRRPPRTWMPRPKAHSSHAAAEREPDAA